MHLSLEQSVPGLGLNAKASIDKTQVEVSSSECVRPFCSFPNLPGIAFLIDDLAFRLGPRQNMAASKIWSLIDQILRYALYPIKLGTFHIRLVFLWICHHIRNRYVLFINYSQFVLDECLSADPQQPQLVALIFVDHFPLIHLISFQYHFEHYLPQVQHRPTQMIGIVFN